MPCPNRCCQTRLTITRGGSGFCGLVSQFASSCRPLWAGSTLGASGTLTSERKPRGTDGPELRQLLGLLRGRGLLAAHLQEHRRVVVVEPAAAHLVADAGTVVGAVEDAGQGVVVQRRDRVELVIVAAGAAHRQGQDRAR